MSEKTDKKIVDRIKKLLIKHDGCKKIQSEAEAEVALKLAFNLMRKHHLDMSAVLTENAITDDEIFIIEKECEKFIANDLPVWIQNLIQLINIVCNTECILRKYKTNRSAKQLYINFIGEAQDISRCIDMYKFFKSTASKLGYKHQRSVNGNFTNWRSFVEGFTGRLLERAIIEEKQEYQKIKKQEQENSGFQDIDDLDDIGDEDETTDQLESQSFELTLKTNELIQLNRYKNYVKDKIKLFIKQQEAQSEKLKESKRIDSASFNQGRIAANQYNLSKNSVNCLKLEDKIN